jgi:hypothetical protein
MLAPMPRGVEEPIVRRGPRRTARRLALAGFLAAAAGALAAEAAPRGRVIRVERSPANTVPRFCSLTASGGDGGLCFGRPRPGERFAIVAPLEPRLRGEFIVESVAEPTELISRGLCPDSDIHVVKGSFTAGADQGGYVMGLRAAKLDPRIARVMPDVPAPSGRDEESVHFAIDSDADGRADLMVTEYSCDASGTPTSGGSSLCFDVYMDQRGTMRRVQQDILRVCH